MNAEDCREATIVLHKIDAFAGRAHMIQKRVRVVTSLFSDCEQAMFSQINDVCREFDIVDLYYFWVKAIPCGVSWVCINTTR
ncbi:Uncharacterised protein [Klebsiella quasipneumoniae]|nr:Uncharacterised protein [Klebsiella quasipneumoniae]